MTDFRLVGYNEILNRLEVPQGSDRYHSAQPVIFDDTLTVTGLVNGRDIAADGTKLNLATLTAPTDLDAMRVALGYITVTQAVDLDALETRVDALSASVVLMGLWDASTNLFPVSTKSGESWICSDDGSVGGVSFKANDRVVALVDDASTSNYNNWHKLDYTDEVLSVAGRTGSVTLVEADITDLQGYLLPVDLDSLGKLNTLVGESLMVAGDPLETSGVKFQPQASDPAHVPGTIWYSAEFGGGFKGYVEELDITMNLGEEEWLTVRNDTGDTIPDGTPVYISGYVDGLPQVTPILANGERLVGLVTHSLEDGTVGKATRGGKLTGPDFSGFDTGDTVYVSTTVAGEIVNVIPVWPATAIEIGTIMLADNPGSINIDLEHHGDRAIAVKSYNFSARTASSGEYFLGGFYEHADLDANLDQAGDNITFGEANQAHGGHAFIVFGAAATDGANVILTASGTSIESGVLTEGDSEVLYTGPVSGLTLNDYLETSFHWVGIVTFTLTSDGVNYSMDFNYGLCKYEDFNNTNIIIRHIECVGLADANDSGFNIEFIHHKPTGHTYAATSFHMMTTPEESLNADYGAYSNLVAGKNFSWKPEGIVLDVKSSGKEGTLLRITTGTNNSVAYMSAHVGGVIYK